VTIAGRPGIVHIATAVRANRPGDVVIYQVMLGGDDNYVLMVGICDESGRAEFLDVFAATALTYQAKP
jgi:hypothetical protein